MVARFRVVHTRAWRRQKRWFVSIGHQHPRPLNRFAGSVRERDIAVNAAIATLAFHLWGRVSDPQGRFERPQN